MVRKRLADLLQEEAQKFTPSQGESVIEIAAEVIAEKSDSPTEEPPAQISESTAALEATIKELRTTLEKSQKQETILQKEITDLQSALSSQKAATENLTKELDETKKTALQLAEANSKLIAEINGSKQTKEIVKAPVNTPVKEAYNPLNYKKSHRSPERLQEQPTQANDDFANNTWLYD
jgi:chromosome segregation ATPase